MLLSKILEVTMSDYTSLKNNIKRSELAYQLYSRDKRYHQALHIHCANKIVYDELNKLLSNEALSDSVIESAINYLFHLEDWFLQFSILEKDIEDPQHIFSFLPLEKNIPYPSNFVEVLTK